MKKRKKCQGVYGNLEKPVAILSMENENKLIKTSGHAPNDDAEDTRGNINHGFNNQARESNEEESSDSIRQQMTLGKVGLAEQVLRNDSGEPIKFIDAEGRSLNQQELRRHTRDNDFYKNSDYQDKNEAIFHGDRAGILGALDETDTPKFPINTDRHQSMFSKTINPGVKIMQVERITEDTFNNNHGR
uniref:Uncharacterized protein n=1 Tax=Bracon brevicornis TaxID=1563983 RepID=A0A6V7K8Y0_9HYME